MSESINQIPLPQGGNLEATPDLSPTTQARLLQTTILVTNEGEDFEFTIPTCLHEVRISSMIPRLRRLADPDSVGESLEGLDPAGYFYLRSLATFIACLKSTSAKWIYAPGVDGKPVVKWEQWPAEVTGRVLEIALAFQEEVSRFHSGRAAEEQPPRE